METNDIENKEKKIAVVGIGGVGGYLAGMLARTYPHVTLVARGDRKTSIEEKGIVLHSEKDGEIVVHPERVVASAEELVQQDYIFICVKNYSLEEVCAQLQGAVTEETVIIPVMNGADTAERTRRYLGKGTVVDALIYIVAYANADYSITQEGDFADLRIGIMNPQETELRKVNQVSALLTNAGVDHKASDDIEREIWRKYILNCAYNVASAYYDNNIGELRSDPEKAQEYEQLVQEAYQVAVAKKVHVLPEHVDAIIHRFYYELADGATSSLQRDIRAGKRAETDTFSGYIVTEAERLGIEVPVSRRMYEGLRAKTL
ncbi:ketopantoate reductase family protein [Hespellia stercorisuis]|uniref:2-dehydropantoate 2-reductase n=1 Tax=Hespellia stercorisuis DSM 15480 TaxID=1121950 RepID=A0A1M6V4I7_9FIRM|nr:2-dehydropantoate 2-reductase [Hespellia stercorisuis]SHK76281.1 2-dehydropantoate 2-reductase [Hespellia stercorisuis DSM 15480]